MISLYEPFFAVVGAEATDEPGLLSTAGRDVGFAVDAAGLLAVSGPRCGKDFATLIVFGGPIVPGTEAGCVVFCAGTGFVARGLDGVEYGSMRSGVLVTASPMDLEIDCIPDMGRSETSLNADVVFCSSVRMVLDGG